VHLLILIYSLPQNSRAEITLACVRDKCNPAHRTAVLLPYVGISTIVGGRARGRIYPVMQIK